MEKEAAAAAARGRLARQVVAATAAAALHRTTLCVDWEERHFVSTAEGCCILAILRIVWDRGVFVRVRSRIGGKVVARCVW